MSFIGVAALAAPIVLASPAYATNYSSIYFSQNTDHCIDDPFNSTDDGTQLQEWSCLDNANQEFVAIPVTGGYEIRMQNGKCVDGTGTSDGLRLQIWTCNGDASQIWNSFQAENFPSSQGYGLADLNGMFMDRVNDSVNDGTKMQVWYQPSYTADNAETLFGLSQSNGNSVPTLKGPGYFARTR
jgi:hypothetical protein